MATFRAKPTEVEAVRWDGENFAEVCEAFRPQTIAHDPSSHALLVPTALGRVRCMSGDWVVRDPSDRFTVQGDADFRETYEPVVLADA